MKVLNIVIGGKTYTTERITTGLSREAMRVNAEALEYAIFCRNPPEGDKETDFAAEILNKGLELSDRKLNLICRVYGNQFGINDLEDSLTNAEVDMQINKIVLGVGGIALKN